MSRMQVTMRSDDSPDVSIEAVGYCNLERLDQHIRTLQAARTWLQRELQRKKAAKEAAQK